MNHSPNPPPSIERPELPWQHHCLTAPEGPRTVATGGAKRNPWKGLHMKLPRRGRGGVALDCGDYQHGITVILRACELLRGTGGPPVISESKTRAGRAGRPCHE
jgi:hypothetical protein